MLILVALCTQARSIELRGAVAADISGRRSERAQQFEQYREEIKLIEIERRTRQDKATGRHVCEEGAYW